MTVLIMENEEDLWKMEVEDKVSTSNVIIYSKVVDLVQQHRVRAECQPRCVIKLNEHSKDE